MKDFILAYLLGMICSVLVLLVLYLPTASDRTLVLDPNFNSAVLVITTLSTQLGLGFILYRRIKSDRFPTGSLHISFNHPAGIFGTALAYFILSLILAALLNLILARFVPNISEQKNIIEALPKSFWWFFVISVIIAAPIVEELFFRGYLLPVIASRNELNGLFISSAIFAALHLQSALTFLQLFLFGYILGYSYLRTKNLLVNILIHALKNGLAFIVWYYG